MVTGVVFAVVFYGCCKYVTWCLLTKGLHRSWIVVFFSFLVDVVVLLSSSLLELDRLKLHALLGRL